MYVSSLLAFVASSFAADYNADGLADVVVGAWQEDIAGVSAGAIYPIYGDHSGLSAGWADRMQRSEFGATAEEYDYLGDVMASGDFNGDGRDDLALGVPEAEGGEGIVYVVYGTAAGLDAATVVRFEVGVGGILGAPAGAAFGSALAAGDFNGDGYADLAVGAPGELDPRRVSAGAVHVMYGSPLGLLTSGNHLFNQGFGAGDRGEAGDDFGDTLAAGDLNGDGRDDLVIAATGERIGAASRAGAVHVLYGTSVGVGRSTQPEISQDSPGIPDLAETEDAFGSALSIGDFLGTDHCADLAVGTPGESLAASAGAGSVTVIHGSRLGVILDKSVFLTENSFGVTPQSGSEFGFSLASGDLQGDGHADLAVGAPGDDVAKVRNAGSAYIASGGDLSWRAFAALNKETSGIEGIARTDGFCATSVAIADFDGDGLDDLMMSSGTGEIAFVRGDPSLVGFSTVDDELVASGTFGFPKAGWSGGVLR